MNELFWNFFFFGNNRVNTTTSIFLNFIVHVYERNTIFLYLNLASRAFNSNCLTMLSIIDILSAYTMLI